LVTGSCPAAQFGGLDAVPAPPETDIAKIREYF
jgi:hypothetical protein